MKFIDHYDEYGKPVFVQVYWGDHWPGCEKCREVDLEKPLSFVSTCALGSQLISEEMVKRQAPIVAKKRDEVKKWAKRMGVFKI